ncbi:hypothetical protein NC652_000744 [Populus alba x Populus x berolinensis]|nr:hypothetical protein NC652_000744 [Populus alba x Populus x berolinensis]
MDNKADPGNVQLGSNTPLSAQVHKLKSSSRAIKLRFPVDEFAGQYRTVLEQGDSPTISSHAAILICLLAL